MEALVGSREVALTGPGGLINVVSRLSEQVAVLQPSYLEQVEARIFTLQEKLNKIKISGNDSLFDADSQNKVICFFLFIFNSLLFPGYSISAATYT